MVGSLIFRDYGSTDRITESDIRPGQERTEQLDIEELFTSFRGGSTSVGKWGVDPLMMSC